MVQPRNYCGDDGFVTVSELRFLAGMLLFVSMFGMSSSSQASVLQFTESIICIAVPVVCLWRMPRRYPGLNSVLRWTRSRFTAAMLGATAAALAACSEYSPIVRTGLVLWLCLGCLVVANLWLMQWLRGAVPTGSMVPQLVAMSFVVIIGNINLIFLITKASEYSSIACALLSLCLLTFTRGIKEPGLRKGSVPKVTAEEIVLAFKILRSINQLLALQLNAGRCQF